MALRTLSMCSGVGGLDLGLRLAANARTVCYVEYSHFPAAVLASRMADKTMDEAPVWDDVGTFDGRPWRGAVDLVCAGFPCQPVSLAGKRLGMADERFIWGDIERIVGDVAPRYVFLENVPGIVTADDGWFLDRVLSGLVSLGFDCEWDIFSAEETGAPHRRQRWFCLGVAQGNPGRQHAQGVQQTGSTPWATERSHSDVANTGHDGRRVLKTPSGYKRDGGREPFSESGTDGVPLLGDPTGGARQWQAPGTSGHAALAGEDSVADAEPMGPGRDTQTAGGNQRNGGDTGRSEETGRSCQCGPIVADTEHPEHEWDRQSWNGWGQPANDGVYPPGRNEYGRWEGINADAQPAFRRMADGLAEGLDESLFAYRNDRLRAVGNGVAPLTAALAWRELIARHGGV